MDRVLGDLCDSFASFAVKDLDRKGRKVYRKGRKRDLKPSHLLFYNARAYEIEKTAKPHPMPVDALVYPRFSGVPTFMRLPHIPRAGTSTWR